MADDWRLDGGVVTAAAGVRIARLAAVDLTGAPLVAIGESGADAVAARSTVQLAPADAGRSAVLVFEEGDLRRPIVIGLLQDRPIMPLPDAPAATDEPEHASSRRDVRIDGRSVSLEATQELTLRCGQASVTLRADGRIVIKGMEIVSRARGTHKVKGATVLIN
jgi:Domain of unknown function (DUF6484)